MTTRGITARGSFALVAAFALLLTAAAAHAASTGIRTFYIDEAALGETGFTIEADWSQANTPQVGWDGASPVTQAYPPDGFILLDGTLGVSMDVPDGQMRLRARIAYKPDELRAIGWDGQTPPRMLRKRIIDQRAYWRPIREVMRIRDLRARRIIGRASFKLGHYGVDMANEYVWAVIDVPGTFAIGIPEPASLLCLAGGIGALILRRPRRHARA